MAKKKSNTTILIWVGAIVAVGTLLFFIFSNSNKEKTTSTNEEEDAPKEDEPEYLDEETGEINPSTTNPAPITKVRVLGQDTLCVKVAPNEFNTWNYDENKSIPEYEGFGQDVEQASLTGDKDQRKITAKAFFKAIDVELTRAAFYAYQIPLEEIWYPQYSGISHSEVKKGSLRCPVASGLRVSFLPFNN